MSTTLTPTSNKSEIDHSLKHLNTDVVAVDQSFRKLLKQVKHILGPTSDDDVQSSADSSERSSSDSAERPSGDPVERLDGDSRERPADDSREKEKLRRFERDLKDMHRGFRGLLWDSKEVMITTKITLQDVFENLIPFLSHNAVSLDEKKVSLEGFVTRVKDGAIQARNLVEGFLTIHDYFKELSDSPDGVLSLLQSLSRDHPIAHTVIVHVDKTRRKIISVLNVLLGAAVLAGGVWLGNPIVIASAGGWSFLSTIYCLLTPRRFDREETRMIENMAAEDVLLAKDNTRSLATIWEDLHSEILALQILLRSQESGPTHGLFNRRVQNIQSKKTRYLALCIQLECYGEVVQAACSDTNDK